MTDKQPGPLRTASPRRAILVLGMHRSGTSALTRTLNLLGAALPADLMPSGPDNVLGFWESQFLMQTHERLLGSAGTSWHGLGSIPDSWYESNTAAGFRAQLSDFVREEFGSNELFVLKDPRVSLFVPIWLEVLRDLDIEPLPVLVLRNPIEVTASLTKRNGFSEARSYFLWLRYMLEAESSTRSTRRSIIQYESLLEQWEEQSVRLFGDLGLPWHPPEGEDRSAISNFLTPAERHHFSSRKALEADRGLAEWFPLAYRLLLRLENDPHDGKALGELDLLRSSFNTASRVFFPLLTEQVLENDSGEEAVRSPNWETLQAFLTMQLEVHRRDAEGLRRDLEEHRQQVASLGRSKTSLERELAERSNNLEDVEKRLVLAEQSAGRLRGEARRTSWQLEQWARKAGRLAVQLRAAKSDPLGAAPTLVSRGRRLLKWTASLMGLDLAARSLYRRIGGSGLFDAAFYAEQLGLADPGETDLLKHYLRNASDAGAHPNPLFDTAYYLRTYEDVAIAGMHPVDHYLRYGAFEGRSPHPLFDTRLYRELYPEVVASGENPLAHYLRVGGHEVHRRTHPLFDPEFYCSEYPDVAQFHVNPLVHYLKYGNEQRLRPNADFDPAAYEVEHPEIARSDVTPLEHFAEFGVWSAGDFYQPDRHLSAEPQTADRGQNRVSRWQTLADPGAIDRNTKLNHLLNDFENTVSDRPVASIVIPVFGQLDLTVHCLWSLSQFRNRTPCEVIVVNDCSPDESKEVLQLIPGLRLVDNESNSGFVVSCNRGAEASRGEFVVFLNNDTAVLDGWLDELVSVFRRIPEAGFASSKLLYPDGTLQEAGCVVWDDGSAWNLGRNGDPGRPEYNFLRDVHYGSGASVMTPVALFREIGGFDLDFQPGYYEDVDYAYSVRSAGRRVIYQPASQLIHFEGQTGGTDVSTGAKQYQVVNRGKFKQKWADALTHEVPETVPIYKADTKDARAHVLFIEPTFLTPDRDAGSAMSFNLIRALVRQGMKVSFVASENLDYDSRYTSLLQDEGVECLYRPYYENLDDVLKRRPDAWDFIFIARLHCITEVFDDVRVANPSAKIIYQTIDLSSLRERRELELGLFSGSKRDVEEKEAVELKYIEACDKSIIVSTFERDLLASRGLGDKVASMPLLAYDYPPPELDRRRGIMFIGGFRHRPNIDAVQFLAEEIAPRVLDVDPDQTFYIVGGDVPDELKELASSNILFMGQIEDPDSFFLGMRLSIAPLRYGAGIKGKVIQSLSAGLPCVGTNLAAEGIGDADATGLWIADDAKGIAEGILMYASDDAAWLRAATRGYEFARLRYSREALERDVESFVKTLA